MSKHEYPDNIIYYGQNINTRISLKEEFKEERKVMRVLPEDHPENKYISEAMQEKYLVDLSEENFFIDSNHDFLDGEYNFVLTCESPPKLLCDKTAHHSYLANGKKVLAVGTLKFEKGILLEITNNSGHYRPTNEEMLAIIKALYIASNQKMQRYKSYCTEQSLVYPVTELVKSDRFSAVEPLKKDEIINTVTGNRTRPSDYDMTTSSAPNTDQRFGRALDPALARKYSGFLNSSFFTPADKDNTVTAHLSSISL